MDRLSQADAVLAAALVYSPAVVIPGRALSPMDCDSTIRVTRTVVCACDSRAQEVPPPAPVPGSEEPTSVEPVSADPVSVEPDGAHTEAHSRVRTDLVLDAEMVRASRGRRAADEVGRTA